MSTHCVIIPLHTFQLISFMCHNPSTHFSVDLIYVSLFIWHWSVDLIYVSLLLPKFLSWSHLCIIIPLHTFQLSHLCIIIPRHTPQLISFTYNYSSSHSSFDLIYVSLSLYTLLSWSNNCDIIPQHTPQPSTWWALITCTSDFLLLENDRSNPKVEN